MASEATPFCRTAMASEATPFLQTAKAAATRLRGPASLGARRRGALSTARSARNPENLRPLRNRHANDRFGWAARTFSTGWSGNMTSGGGTSASAGQAARHVPVLLTQAMHMLAPREG